ncbi:MAG: zinc-binding dehydrogenase [Nitriliruptorales bacterium]|nr:zinc-binding dehydrogenase [Nitriliruptorales bacterium]
MRAVIAPEPGGPEALKLVETPDPTPGPGEALVRVEATALNRADLMQRKGHYPPPPGASEALGLELAGTVIALGAGARGWAVGDEAMAVVSGGGYAELAAVPASCLLPVPTGVSLIEAAAIPEVFTTVYDNMLLRGRLAGGETVLVHGGSSGIGTAAIQLARRAGARVLVTASSQAKLEAAARLGAEVGIDYTTQDFVVAAREATDGRGVNVILDVVGGRYLARNLDALALEGRLVIIGLQGGAEAEVNLGQMLSRRLSVAASSLRARSVEEKAGLAERMRRVVLPGFSDGTLRPVIDRVLSLDEVAEAHRLMDAGDHIGKIVLQVG